MGRQLERQDSDIEFQNYHPGCIWGIFHILDHHHRHNVKKMLPRRKHSARKRAICCRNPKTVSFDHFPNEVHEYLDSDAVPLLVEERAAETSPTSRFSGEAHIKALMAKEMASRSQLQQTDLIHHLGPSEHHVGRRNISWGNPIIILHKSVDTTASRTWDPTAPKISEELVSYNDKYRSCGDANAKGYVKQNRSLSRAKHLDRRTSCPQFKEHVDDLEIFKVNKKIFLEILKDPDVQVAMQQTSNAKMRLKKSGSFPVPVSSHDRFARPTTLEHKQKEVWSFPSEKNLPIGVLQELKSVASKSSEDSYEKSRILKADNTGAAAVTQETSFSASSHGLSKHGWHQWHQSFSGHIRYIKKKIKHALKESRKENEHALANTVHSRVPSECKLSTDEKDTREESKEITINQADVEAPESFREADSSEIDLSKSGQTHIRKPSSLNESMDKYARLFEHSFSGETKWHQYKSNSLKLTNEDTFPPSKHGLKSFRRKLSLPDLESFCSFPDDVSRDVFSSELPIGSVTSYDIIVKGNVDDGFESSSIQTDKEQFEQSQAHEDAELRKQMVETNSSIENKENLGGVVEDDDDEIIKTVAIHEDVVDPEKWEHGPYQDQEIGSTIKTSGEDELETLFEDNITGSMQFPISDSSGLEASATKKYESVATVNIKAENQIEFAGPEDADFNYVRDVLEMSGFIDQECVEKWHSIDQPLSSTLFKEFEACKFHLECSSEDTGYNCNHQLLFDLMNEELLKIYESSLAYFPMPFSITTRRVHHSLKGNHVLEEVWKRISWYKISRLEDESLDDVVGRDLGRSNGWMNLMFDAEDVSLDLEDLIFDELLDELICS